MQHAALGLMLHPTATTKIFISDFVRKMAASIVKWEKGTAANLAAFEQRKKEKHEKGKQ
jgi:hypothetical protein